jgi:AcrR family transcriptional regulator
MIAVGVACCRCTTQLTAGNTISAAGRLSFTGHEHSRHTSLPRVSGARERARRDQIIDAAASCFSRNGFAATTMPEIAAAAELSAGAFYRYFVSKEDLFLTAVAERVAVYNNAVFVALHAPGQPLQRLQRALRSLQRLLASQPPEAARLSLELWARAHDQPPLGIWLREAPTRRFDAFRRVIQEANLANQLRADLRMTDSVATLMVLADGLVVHRACAPFQHAGGNAFTEVEGLLKSWTSTPVTQESEP